LCFAARALAIGTLLLVLLPGCEKGGPELAPVSGRITLDGKPLDPADILFQPDGSKPPSFGRTNQDGRYELVYKRGVKGAWVGPHTVRIMVVTEQTHGPQLVPPRYNTESELRVEVAPDTENEFNFDLTTEPK
jgi:hypothetical protein